MRKQREHFLSSHKELISESMPKSMGCIVFLDDHARVLQFSTVEKSKNLILIRTGSSIKIDPYKRPQEKLEQREATPKLSSVPTGSTRHRKMCKRKSTFFILVPATGVLASCIFPLVLFQENQRVFSPLVVNCHVSATKMLNVYIKCT